MARLILSQSYFRFYFDELVYCKFGLSFCIQSSTAVRYFLSSQSPSLKKEPSECGPCCISTTRHKYVVLYNKIKIQWIDMWCCPLVNHSNAHPEIFPGAWCLCKREKNSFIYNINIGSPKLHFLCKCMFVRMLN